MNRFGPFGLAKVTVILKMVLYPKCESHL